MQDSQFITIPGPTGDLEAMLTQPADAGGAAVLCHPHPQYGGSMYDGVLAIAADTLAQQKITSLRFNFRGVGGSAGQYADGVGEVDDVIAVAAWARAELAPSTLSLVGYSFGASVGWRAVDQLGALSRVVLIAPPVGMMEFAVHPDLPADVHVIAGTRDTFVDLGALAAWAAAGGNVQVHEVEGADHFFGGYAEDLGEALMLAIA